MYYQQPAATCIPRPDCCVSSQCHYRVFERITVSLDSLFLPPLLPPRSPSSLHFPSHACTLPLCLSLFLLPPSLSPSHPPSLSLSLNWPYAHIFLLKAKKDTCYPQQHWTVVYCSSLYQVFIQIYTGGGYVTHWASFSTLYSRSAPTDATSSFFSSPFTCKIRKR